MRTDPDQDPVASARRRLDEFARRWSPQDPVARPAAEPPARPTSEAVLPPGRHAGQAPLAPRFGAGISVQRRHLGLIVLAAALFVLVAIWWAARGAAEPMPVPDTTPDTTPAAATLAASSSAGATPESSAGSSATAVPSDVPSSATVVVVDVAGKVRRPAVLTLPAGSRVIDAIRRAGGPRRGVDLSPLNLARVLVDGEQILVGVRADRVPATNPSASGAGAAAGGGSRPNLNSATLQELDALPGVGPVTAQKIIDWRTENGPFNSAEQLLEVDGIGPKTLAEIAPEVTW